MATSHGNQQDNWPGRKGGTGIHSGPFHNVCLHSLTQLLAHDSVAINPEALNSLLEAETQAVQMADQAPDQEAFSCQPALPWDPADGYYRIFRHSNDAIFLIDLDRDQILDANPRACQMLEYSREELLAIPMSQVHPHDMCQLRSFAGEVMKQGYGWTDELSCVTRSHKVIPAEVSASVVEVAGRRLLISMVRDVTERKRAQEDLRRSQQRFRALVEQAADGFYVISQQGRLVDVNQAACSSLGYSRDELLSLTVMDVVVGSTAQSFQQVWQSLNPGMAVTREGEHRHQDCSTFPVEARVGLLDLDDGVHMFALARDISERRRTEELLHQRMRQLAVAEERNRLAREIHDTLAQGLVGIIWQLNVLDRPTGDTPEHVRQALACRRELAQENLQEVRRAVWDLRDRGHQSLSLANTLRAEAESLLGDSPVSFSISVEGEERALPPGIEAALVRIVQEALANVRKHAAASQASLILSYASEQVNLTVQDNGQGFSEAPAFRSREHGGFGILGMRERAAILGGNLQVESVPGHGTTVRIAIPLH